MPWHNKVLLANISMQASVSLHKAFKWCAYPKTYMLPENVVLAAEVDGIAETEEDCQEQVSFSFHTPCIGHSKNRCIR